MALGYVVLSVPILATPQNKSWLLPLTCFALFMIAFGNGLFKGNLQAIVGTVCVGGMNVSSMPEKQLVKFRREFLGMIFQFHYLLKDFTALENVFLPAFIAGVSKKHAMEKAEELLCAVGLKERMSHLPSELSGGERQRVSVARSLVNNPELILADEPTGNLDPANAEAVGNLLFSLSEKYGKTLILVTHDMNLASKGQIKYSIENGQLQELEI